MKLHIKESILGTPEGKRRWDIIISNSVLVLKEPIKITSGLPDVTRVVMTDCHITIPKGMELIECDEAVEINGCHIIEEDA